MTKGHDSASTHVTGYSEFVDDRPFLSGELVVALLYSPHAHAEIEKIEVASSLKIPGVAGIFTAEDLAHNTWGTIFQDQPVIAKDKVHFVGEVVAVVAAESLSAAKQALQKMKVRYKVLPALLDIQSAREAKSFIGTERTIARGDVEKALETAPHQLSGRVIIRGADHFYLESQAVIAYSKEDGQIEVHSSSQHPTEVQHVVAHALGLDDKDVVCIVKRMGGAFGGKESQAAPFAAYAALVAHKTKRPARLILTKDDDMIMTGKRNPFENDYRVGFDQTGRLLALDVKLYSDGGAYADLSTAIMERAMLHCDNAYYIPHFRARGQVCRTHVHPHTAFRGFGGPKGVATIEYILEEIAHYLKKDPLDIRKLNTYALEGERSFTPYGQKVENNVLPELFAELEKKCEYRQRRIEIKKSNAKSTTHRRGLSMTAVKFGISFTTRFLNQGNALVHVHRDGSLQISTGATEMGQGVNARIAHLVSEEFGLPRSLARVMPTSTDKNANTSPTAASSGTDINGAAAVLAARQIKARLSQLALTIFKTPKEKWAKNTAGLGSAPEIFVEPHRFQGHLANEQAQGTDDTARFDDVVFEGENVFLRTDSKNKMSFAELVNEAYLNRVSLSGYAHYRIPDLAFNKLSGHGRAFLYFTQGVAASEVKVDVRTGEVKVLRTDILMDLGRPILEELDLGQISGGFIQGMGWVTTENLFYSHEGKLLSHSPSTYKIPNVQDTPRIFNIDLLPNTKNTANLRQTKASGEPPLLLSISVWTAIHDAIKDIPRPNFPHLQIPATQEVVLRAIKPDYFRRWEAEVGK